MDASSELPEYHLPPLSTLRRPERRWKHGVLLLLTFVTTTVVGSIQYYSFIKGTGGTPPQLWTLAFFANGLWYSLAALGILGAHELGHYFACRYYGVDCSLPYFLPLPPPFLFGTLGAFIRIRQPIRTKSQLFDIGIAGPIAGFLVAVPILFAGVRLSAVITLPEDFQGVVYEFGEPLMYRIAERLTFDALPAGHFVNLHPLGFAAWFGLLATALNLFPIGQLDGGHITYAVLGRKSTLITVGTVVSLLVLTFFSMSWILWTVLTIVMLFMFGPHHPRTVDEHVPLDPARTALALFAVAMFVLCFTPSPIEMKDLIGGASPTTR